MDFRRERPRMSGITLRTSTSELRVRWHRIMAAVLALKPAFDSGYHRAKFVFDSAVRATDDWLRAVHHVGRKLVCRTRDKDVYKEKS